MKRIITAAVSIFLISCSMAPGKKEVKHSYKIPGRFENMSAKVEKKQVSEAKWWKSFNDETLNRLIDLAVDKNLDVLLAMSRVRQLESQFDISRGNRYPTVNAGAGYGRSRAPVPSFDPATMSQTTKPKTSNAYTLRAGLRFEIDVWGKWKSIEESSLNELLASKADLRTVYLRIIATTATIYYDIMALKKSAEITERNINLIQNQLELKKQRYENGIGSAVNVDTFSIQLNGLKSRLEAQKQETALKNHQLAVIIGEYPKDIIMDDEAGEILQELKRVPAGIPSDLLKNRSDIVASEKKMESARYMIGAARADLFPSISLTGTLGYLNLSNIEKLFTKDHLTSAINIDASQTIFAGGSKLAAIDQRKEIYESAVLNYKKTVLEAFREVEDALIKLKTAEEQYGLAEENIKNSRKSRKETEERYRNGIIPFEMLLQADTNLLKAENQLLDAKKFLIFSRVELHRTLGGNWEG